MRSPPTLRCSVRSGTFPKCPPRNLEARDQSCNVHNVWAASRSTGIFVVSPCAFQRSRTVHKLPVSIPYTLRMLMIDSEIDVADAPLAQTRRFDMGTVPAS